MRILKKMDRYIIRNFLGLFVLTFMICCFILLMQLLWMRINDIVGKGVEIKVLLEFLVYATVSVVPMALPLAILLASLMSFGNLGEKFELTAMKSAGISLFRIMRPLTIFIGMVSVGAFFFSNYVLPPAQTSFWALVFSLRQKSPELELPESEFCDRIPGYNVYAGKKDVRTGLLHDLMIYDYRQGFDNASVTLADSGRIMATEDCRYLVVKLYNGESFENLEQQQRQSIHGQQNVPYRRATFSEQTVLIDFNTQLERYDPSVFEDQHISKKMGELILTIDSVNKIAGSQAHEQSQDMVSNRYFGREQTPNRDLGEINADEATMYDPDSIYSRMSDYSKLQAWHRAVDRANAQKDQITYNTVVLDDLQRQIRKHEVELHRKFTLAFACLIFFFIGAPLGAIIRKGGLGAPIVISVVMFIIYYIIDNAGYKMAREALWPCWLGMWLSSLVLLPIGIFLTYKAATDSGLFNPEVWYKIYGKCVVWCEAKWEKLTIWIQSIRH